MFGQAVNPSLPQADPLTGTAASLATLSLALAGVAALARAVMGLALPSSSPSTGSGQRSGHSSNPIPWGEKERLYRLYGKWAVGRAEADCPQGDVACVEREAKRLYEVRIARRR